MTIDTGEIVRTVSDGFRGNPACLAAVMLSAMFGILTYFSLTADKAQQQERFVHLLDGCMAKMPRDGPPND